MIILCGDTHGEIFFDKVDRYFAKLSRTKTLTKSDYLIILGDAMVLSEDAIGDEVVQDMLNALPVTVLFIDGNHDSMERLNELPIEIWHGGKTHNIDGIRHLMRGQVYEIQNRKFFTFGGAYSANSFFPDAGKAKNSLEMPSAEEYAEGLANLKNESIDYILAHTCPYSVARHLAGEHYVSGEEELEQYLENVCSETKFKRFFYGHWHRDDFYLERYQCLWEKFVLIGA